MSIIMNEADGRHEKALATAARELFVLGQKTVEARAVLGALQKELSDANTQLMDNQQVEQLIEANQQLVLAILSAQSDAQNTERTDREQRLFVEMREANEQLVIAALSAQQLQASAEYTLQQQRNTLAVVAHELRNPLTPISMIAGRLARVPSAELPRMQHLIEGQVKHMSRLVEDLLDVSRATSGKLRLDCSLIDIVPVIEDAVEMCRSLMTDRGLHFIADVPQQPQMIKGDAVRLTQILDNLLGNAAKYTPAGGVVTLGVTAQGHNLIIRIRDNGIGISAQALPFIFEPFVQDNHAMGFNSAGLGIGLTVVRDLVEAHGGRVTGRSEGDGQGSEFVVTLPLI